MAVMDTTRTASPAGIRGGLFKVFSRLVAWNEARRTRKILSTLSDRELEDIGLTRSDIEALKF
ncbi:DUF1127 domain-containing protein [Roseovarius amoyensis]|uniref:DUF1127 domain-containing protein n=1 Tax=Roseovarius amoyensis TaxID=2211448 RepID=UPI000DBE9747|nr:DUF1127 domain-containing protein [Roseovarius amoyensis]